MKRRQFITLLGGAVPNTASTTPNLVTKVIGETPPEMSK